MVRTRIEIYAEMLELTQIESRKTQLVYGCNLNFHTVKRYLKHLLERGLIKEIVDRKHRYYVTTDEGLKTLRALRSINI